MEAIALRVEAIAIAIRLEAIALKLEAIAVRLEAIAIRFGGLALSLQGIMVLDYQLEYVPLLSERPILSICQGHPRVIHGFWKVFWGIILTQQVCP